MTAHEKAILKTLAYSNVFGFPLTKEELWHFLISETSIPREDFEHALKTLSSKILYKEELYSLAGSKEYIKRRIHNSREVQKKMRIAKRAAFYLSYIPTISLIDISGGLAMGNASKEDDIDLFIIAKKNTLFMTRVWVQAILEMLLLRRKRNATNTSNKICVNLLIDESRLIWPGEARDVYTAHEIAQLKPLFERRDMYRIFLEKNRWVAKFLPNALEVNTPIIGAEWKRNYVSLRAMSVFIMMHPLEKLAGFLQKNYMKKHKTTEIVTEQVLAFHPFDYRVKTIDDLNAKLAQLGLLTNK